MAVAVFGQLDDLLRQRNLTVADLKRQIEEQYGLDVDAAALERLAGHETLHHIDLKVVGAAASVLEVSLDDLLLVVALPAGLILPQTEPSFLTPEESRRLTELFDRQDEGTITDAEQRELESLVYDVYGYLIQDWMTVTIGGLVILGIGAERDSAALPRPAIVLSPDGAVSEADTVLSQAAGWHRRASAGSSRLRRLRPAADQPLAAVNAACPAWSDDAHMLHAMCGRRTLRGCRERVKANRAMGGRQSAPRHRELRSCSPAALG